MKGNIADLLHKIEVLQNESWIDNRTRAIITEFSVFNAQVPSFSSFGVIILPSVLFASLNVLIQKYFKEARLIGHSVEFQTYTYKYIIKRFEEQNTSL